MSCFFSTANSQFKSSRIQPAKSLFLAFLDRPASTVPARPCFRERWGKPAPASMYLIPSAIYAAKAFGAPRNTTIRASSSQSRASLAIPMARIVLMDCVSAIRSARVPRPATGNTALRTFLCCATKTSWAKSTVSKQSILNMLVSSLIY